MLTKYDTNKQKRIWYYTDDVSKFSNDITNKEHQIEGLNNLTSNWLQEVIINNKGDIVPSKISSNYNYKILIFGNITIVVFILLLLLVGLMMALFVVFFVLVLALVLMLLGMIMGLLKLQF